MKLEKDVCGSYKGGPLGESVEPRSFNMTCPSNGKLIIEKAQYGIHDRDSMEECCVDGKPCGKLPKFAFWMNSIDNDVKEDLKKECESQVTADQQTCIITASGKRWNKNNHDYTFLAFWPSLRVIFYCENKDGYILPPHFNRIS